MENKAELKPGAIGLVCPTHKFGMFPSFQEKEGGGSTKLYDYRNEYDFS